MFLRYIQFSLLAIFLLTTQGVHPAVADGKMVVAVVCTNNAIKKYTNLPDSAKEVPFVNNKIPPEITTRCVTSLMILKNALVLGGINPQLTFMETPNARREEDELVKGYAAISTHLFNESAIDLAKFNDKIYISDPVLEDGDYEKGIFCLPGNYDVLNAHTIEDLKKAGIPLIGIHWNNDNEALQSMGIKEIAKGPTMESLFRMLKAGRADWVPLGFHNSKDLSVTRAGITLVPVKGIKISLRESRHYIVSKVHPDGEKIFQALQKGIKIMREQGMIKKMLTQGGYHCNATRNWKVLNDKSLLTIE